MGFDRNSDDPVQGAAADEDHFRRTTSGGAATRAAAYFRENTPPENPNFEPRISLPEDAVDAISEIFRRPWGDLPNVATTVIDYIAANARPVSIYKEPPKSVDTYREITVFDWAYTGNDGRLHYAGTPEAAKLLEDGGIKLTPVYTVTGVQPPAPAPVEAPFPHGRRLIDVFEVADLAKLPPDTLRKIRGDINGDGPTNAKEYAATVLMVYRRDVWQEAMAKVREYLNKFFNQPLT